jgi:PAS domain S-box-containing protein
MSTAPNNRQEKHHQEKEEKKTYTFAEVEQIVSERTHAIQAECEDLKGENAHLKQRGEALHELIETERALLNIPTDMSVLVDTEGTILTINDTFAELLGQSPGDLIGRRIGAFFWSEVSAWGRDRFDEVLASGTLVRTERRYNNRWYDVVVNPISNDHGPINRVAIIVRDITDRKQTEEALQESETKYRTLIEQSLQSVVIVQDGRIVFANQRTAEVGGYAVEELLAMSPEQVLGIFHPEDRVLIGQCMQGGHTGEPVPFRHEFRFIRRDGVIRYGDMSVTLMHHRGRPAQQIAFVDITDRKQSEEALQASEHRFRAVVEKTSDFILIIDAQGVMVFVSPPIQWIDGFPPEALVGKSAFEMIYPEDIPRAIAFFQDLVQHPGMSTTFEARFRGPRGMHWIETAVTNLLEDPYVRGIVVNGRDVTDRKRTQEALQESEKKYRHLFMDDITGDVVSTPDGRILDCNPAFVRMFGFSSIEEALQTNMMETYPFPDDRKMSLEILKKRGKVENFARMRKRRDGTLIHVVENVVGEFGENGDLVEIRGYLYDDSARTLAEHELKASNDALRQSNEDLERFAYVASHDLQEPLRSMVSFTQLLERRYKGKLDMDADEYIRFIVNSGARLQALINDLLEFSRASTRGAELQPTDTEAIVKESLINLQLVIEESGAVVTHDTLPDVIADPVQLRQVFANLISNAIKFRRPGLPPKIHIAAQKKGGMVQFSISDNGIGIEPRYHDRIFVIFQRLHARDQYEGTGIGLAIVKRIIERHGGQIWVESEPGKGSTFHFSLPHAKPT